MKKTKFYIMMAGYKAKQVRGYFEYIDGVPVGLYKNIYDTWTVTELQTGLAITQANTRKDALKKVADLIPTIREKVLNDIKGTYTKPKEIIKAAYAA